MHTLHCDCCSSVGSNCCFIYVQFCKFILPLSDSIEVILVPPFLNHVTSPFIKSREKESRELYQANSLLNQYNPCILFMAWAVHISMGVQGRNVKINKRCEVLSDECKDRSLVECNAMHFFRLVPTFQRNLLPVSSV